MLPVTLNPLTGSKSMLRSLSNYFVVILATLLMFSSSHSCFAIGEGDTQEFLDSNQYTMNGIKRYEQIFGKDFISTGGLETTRQLTARLDLKPGDKVLDVGCGIGGSAYYMVNTYGASVTCIDLSANMISLAKDRAKTEPASITFEEADVMIREYDPASFDVIYSRDTLLHIRNKSELFEKFMTWLKPGGQLLISDYCITSDQLTEHTKSYLAQRNYFLTNVNTYGELLSSAGFEKVSAENSSNLFISVLQSELIQFEQQKSQFIQAFSEKDYQDLTQGWKDKIERCQNGQQTWGVFQARKPAGTI